MSVGENWSLVNALLKTMQSLVGRPSASVCIDWAQQLKAEQEAKVKKNSVNDSMITIQAGDSTTVRVVAG